MANQYKANQLVATASAPQPGIRLREASILLRLYSYNRLTFQKFFNILLTLIIEIFTNPFYLHLFGYNLFANDHFWRAIWHALDRYLYVGLSVFEPQQVVPISSSIYYMRLFFCLLVIWKKKERRRGFRETPPLTLKASTSSIQKILCARRRAILRTGCG